MEVTIAQRRLLGVGAFLGRLNRNDLDVLGGTHRGEHATARLVASFDVASAEEARAFVEKALVRAETSARPSWDLGRAASWAGNMYIAYFIEADEAWELVRRADALARGRYDGWEAFAVDYVAGRQEFLGKRGKGTDDEVAVAEWLLTSKKSPWVRAPWDTDTAGATAPLHVPREHRVGGARATHATIAAALEGAAAGDVIVLAKGTYAAPMRPERDVVVRAEQAGKKPARVIVEAAGHAVFADGVSFRAEGIELRGTSTERAALAVRDGGVLTLEGCTVASRSHGVAILDKGSCAYLRRVHVDRPADIGVLVSDRAFLHADALTTTGGRLGVSIEKRGKADLRGLVSAGATQVGLLVSGQAEVKARACTIERSGWSGVQVSDDGSLELHESRVANVPVGLLVQRGVLVLEKIEVAAKTNGLELQEGARVKATDLTVTRAGGSAVYVGKGASLAIARSELARARFDGVTCEGTLRAVDVTVRDTKRGAFFVEEGGRAYVAQSVASNVDVFARAGLGARLAISSTTSTDSRLGVAVEGGNVAIESVWITNAREHALQIDGGSLVGGYVTVEGPNESPLVAVSGRVSLATSRLVGAGEIHVGGADVTLRRVTVIVDADCACAVHEGKLALLHCKIEGKGANGVEALGGELTIADSSIEGRECAVVTDNEPLVRIARSELCAVVDVALEVLGKSQVNLTDTRASRTKAGLARVSSEATVAGALAPREAPMVVDLDGEGPLPFELMLHDGPRYSLFGDPEAVLGTYAAAMCELGGDPNGHTVSAYVEAIAERGGAFDPTSVRADPEAGSVAFVSADRDTLLRIARAVRDVDPETALACVRALAEAPP